MSKKAIQKMNGVFASVFAHHGHISKEEAKEISGLEDHEFDHVYDKAAKIADRVMKAEGDKMDKFLEHFGKEIDDFIKEFGDKVFM
jgi:transcription antitermination factor NusA-like protein